jgi:NAD(P)H dehydrogenase (quinone)
VRGERRPAGADLISTGELRLPFGDKRLAPVAGYDAELTANILRDPVAHVGKAYTLTGPEFKDMADFAGDYAAALQRPVVYAPQELESWNAGYIDATIGPAEPHIAEHLKT